MACEGIVNTRGFCRGLWGFLVPCSSIPIRQKCQISGYLEGMPNIYTDSWFQKHSGEIAELNKLINATLDVIEHISKLEDLVVKHGEEDFPKLSEAALHYIPLYVYYASYRNCHSLHNSDLLPLDRDKSQSRRIQLMESIISDMVAKRDCLVSLPIKELVDRLIA